MVGQNGFQEQTFTLIFGISIMILVISSVKTFNFLGEKVSSFTTESFNSFYITTQLFVLFINLILGILGFLICMSFNNFITRSLPNLIGTYFRIRILAICIFLNIIVFTMPFIYSFIYDLYFDFKINQDLHFNLVFSIFSQVSVLISCFLVHPDLTGRKFRKYIKDYTSSKNEMNNNMSGKLNNKNTNIRI